MLAAVGPGPGDIDRLAPSSSSAAAWSTACNCAQQQMTAVSCWQLTEETKHKLVQDMPH